MRLMPLEIEVDDGRSWGALFEDPDKHMLTEIRVWNHKPRLAILSDPIRLRSNLVEHGYEIDAPLVHDPEHSTFFARFESPGTGSGLSVVFVLAKVRFWPGTTRKEDPKFVDEMAENGRRYWLPKTWSYGRAILEMYGPGWLSPVRQPVFLRAREKRLG